MKHIINSMLTILLFLQGSSFANESSLNQHNLQANVVIRYLNSLSSGNIAEIRQTTGGPMRKQYGKLLDNPIYSNHLIDRHVGDSYELIHAGPMAAGKTGVVVSEWPSDGTSIRTIYIVGLGQSNLYVVLGKMDYLPFCKSVDSQLCSD